MQKHKIFLGDNLPILEQMASESVDLIYVDPPFNTGKIQERSRIKTVRSEHGDRVGFQGNRYKTVKIGTQGYSDLFNDYHEFLESRIRQAHRILTPNGTMYLHIDYREVHYIKVLMDQIFGRRNFINEIIWAYDYGGRPRNRWPAKHDNILMYVKDADGYTFDRDAVERIPYMAPGLVTAEKAAKGKLPTDTWWHTIVATNGREKTGYATQKPIGVLRRIVSASSRRGDTVFDFFAGSGTTGAACIELGRRFILIDNNPKAMEVMDRRFAGMKDIEWVGYAPDVGADRTGQPALF